ncbi:MAG: broad specificity phosphatase PhoE [Phycisphaerales bacterium]|jgi:broad specificity phosphatase PhoE
MSKAKRFNLLLVQTGSTEWDRQNRIVGGVDLPLAENAATVSTATAVKPAIVICGPDECSQTSAQNAAAASGTKVRCLDGLANVGMGLWEGMTLEELEERFPSAYRQWRERPDSISAPQGESLGEAENRLTGQIHQAAMKLKGDNPVMMVVLRPMAYALVRTRLLGRSPAELWDVLGSAPEGAESFEVEAGALAPRPNRISA